MTTVLAELGPDGALQSVELPETVRAKITEAPAQALKRAQ